MTALVWSERAITWPNGVVGQMHEATSTGSHLRSLGWRRLAVWSDDLGIWWAAILDRDSDERVADADAGKALLEAENAKESERPILWSVIGNPGRQVVEHGHVEDWAVYTRPQVPCEDGGSSW